MNRNNAESSISFNKLNTNCKNVCVSQSASRRDASLCSKAMPLSQYILHLGEIQPCFCLSKIWLHLSEMQKSCLEKSLATELCISPRCIKNGTIAIVPYGT